MVLATAGLSAVGSFVRADAPKPPATAPATRPAAKHPAADAATRFHLAILQGDADAALRATADTPRPLADQQRRIARLIARMKGVETPFVVHDVQTDGDLAVILVGQPATVGDKTFDADIWFLVRQGSDWRLLPDYYAYNRPEYGFDEARLAAYEKLEALAEKRIRDLKLEITGCAC